MTVLFSIGDRKKWNLVEIVDVYHSDNLLDTDKEGLVFVSSLGEHYVINADYIMSKIYIRELFEQGVLDLTTATSATVNQICLVNPTEEDIKSYF